jgi:hypothetical protein
MTQRTHDAQIQNVPNNQKLQILRNLKSTGCRFNGDHLDLDQLALRSMRLSIGRKVPWLLIEQTVKYVQTIDPVQTNVATALAGILDGTCTIGKTFVVTMLEVKGRLTFDIVWAECVRTFFEKEGKEGKETKAYTIVTKDHIVQFCGIVFAAPQILFPKTANYPKEWFILMLVLQAAYGKNIDDEVIHRAHDSLKPMNRKKKKIIQEISNVVAFPPVHKQSDAQNSPGRDVSVPLPL